MQNQAGYEYHFVWLWSGEKGQDMEKGKEGIHKTKY